MEPITRKEMYLAKISGDYSGSVPEPVTRMDYYMAYAAGAYSGPLPRPIVQREFYWAYICGVTDINLPDPVTRIDMFLIAIYRNVSDNLSEPITREEQYLSVIAENSSYVIRSAECDRIIITDSLEAPFEDFHVYGRSEQKTTTGAQLFDSSTAKEGYYISDTTGDLNVNSEDLYCASDWIKTEAGENITFNDKCAWGAWYDVEKEYISGFGRSTISQSRTIQAPENAVYMRFTVYIENKDVLMVNIGSTALPYEPYTGGRLSPNPDYPQGDGKCRAGADNGGAAV